MTRDFVELGSSSLLFFVNRCGLDVVEGRGLGLKRVSLGDVVAHLKSVEVLVGLLHVDHVCVAAPNRKVGRLVGVIHTVELELAVAVLWRWQIVFELVVIDDAVEHQPRHDSRLRTFRGKVSKLGLLSCTHLLLLHCGQKCFVLYFERVSA